MIKLGSEKVLEMTDLYGLRSEEKAAHISSSFQNEWESAVTSSNRSNSKLLKVIHKVFGRRFYLAGFLKIIYDITQLVSPMFVQWIVGHIREGENSSVFWGYFLAISLFLLQLIGAIFLQQYFFVVMTQGRRIITALMTAVYRKTLSLSPVVKKNFNNGHIITYMTTDSVKIGGLVKNLHMTWSCVLQIVVSVTMLVIMLGWPALTGFSIIVVVVPICWLITRAVRRIRRSALLISAQRKAVLSEVINGIRTIKLNVWESAFVDKISQIRKSEMWKNTQVMLANCFTNSLMRVIPIFVAIISLAVYSIYNSLEPKIIFTCLSYINLLKAPTTFFPSLLASFVEAKISLDRIERFLTAENVEEIQVLTEESEYAIQVKEGSFSWEESVAICEPSLNTNAIEKESEQHQLVDTSSGHSSVDKVSICKTFSLMNINLNIRKGSLVVVVGSLGCGKSSLLSALLGEMKRQHGTITLGGTLAYVPQQAWLKDATIRDNILFGNPLDEDKYNRVIESCCLGTDLKSLECGDRYMVGQKGSMLSGGQKQRVALARALYSDADVYLLDDVLSALDPNVRTSVFHHCICGYLANKTRILVTHQLQFCNFADHVVVMKEGQLMAQGSPKDENFHKEYLQHMSEDSNKHIQLDPPLKNKKIKAPQKSKEDRAKGHIDYKLYLQYLSYMGGIIPTVVILALFTLSQTVQSLNSWFLAFWSKQTNSGAINSTTEQSLFIGIYIALGIGCAVCIFLSEVLMSVFGLKAAKKLHDTAFSKLMAAPIVFFDTTPVGRIMNRFSSDIEIIDNSLITSFKSLLGCLFSVLGTLLVISIIVPWFMIPIIPGIIIYWRTQIYYQKTGCEIKRLISTSKSPLLSHFMETIKGCSVIRSQRKQNIYTKENERLVDQLNLAIFTQIVAQRWIALRLKFFGVSVVLFTALSCLIGHVSATMTGLCLSYALSVTNNAEWLVRYSTDLENDMNAIERILHYCQELPHEESNNEISITDWPSNGTIMLKNVSLKYSTDSEFVLNNINVEIHQGEKIGIIGRTGSGKSSLLSILTRSAGYVQGVVQIDDVDIENISVKMLRSKIAVIPQESSMFSGSLRFNIDPLNQFEDEKIWHALEKVNMKDRVLQMDNELQFPVSENGENFSMGERQLLCICRALLKNSKIVIMDEATSHIDEETDFTVQESLKKEFSDKTVLNIAHRLNTITDSDRIMLIENGSLIAFDIPENVFQILK